MLEILKNKGWEILALNYADVISENEFPDQIESICSILDNWSLEIENHIIKRGGGQADQTIEITQEFNKNNWLTNDITIENKITFENTFLDRISTSTTHKIDHFAQGNNDKLLAIEIEWNNKDEFFDRDFQAMRRLYEAHVIELGIIITRGPELETDLEKMIEKYFIRERINEFSDFDKLSRRILGSDGEERFSFPTTRQKKSIEKKVKNGESFESASASVFKNDKFGGATTNWRQLTKRVERKDAGRTPMLLLGMPNIIVNN